MILPFGDLGGLLGELRGVRRDRRYGEEQDRRAGELDLLERELRIGKDWRLIETREQAANAIRELAPGTPLAQALERHHERKRRCARAELERAPERRQLGSGEEPTED
jgi:hypothetical protein